MLLSYRLREGLSYCQIDSEVIFLDIQSDPYFRLSHSMETAFTAFIEGGQNSEAEYASLTRNNILTVASQVDGSDASQPTIPPPIHSAFELSDPSSSLNLLLLLEVATLVLATWWVLKSRRLEYVMENLIRYRRKHGGKRSLQAATLSTPLICDAANSFNRARLYVPVTTSCLLDSIALTKFLSRRRIDPSLVLGVTHAPFAAHCWVQVGDTVLNDTVGNVTAHTPIRTV